MYHATNQTVEDYETGREAQRVLVRELGNVNYEGDLLTDNCVSPFFPFFFVK